MSRHAFLDKSVLIGYCFCVDIHHENCKEYISKSNFEYYVTDEVAEVFARNKSRMVSNHRKEILKHVRRLENSGYSGGIGPMDLKSLRQNMITPDEYPNSWRYLRDYYREKNFISVGEIQEELRELAREIEARADSKHEQFISEINLWEREQDYPEVQKGLKEIKQDKEEDFWICIDAHSLAANKSGYTELGTTDEDDLGNANRQKLITDVTALDEVENVAVTLS